MEELRFQICPTNEDLNILRSFVMRIHNLPRCILQFSFSAVMTLLLAAARGNGAYMTPLILFSGLLTLFFFYLLVYCIRERPKLLATTEAGPRPARTAIFTPKGFSLSEGSVTSQVLPYRDITGQYWMDDRYILYIDSRLHRELLCIPINENTFDHLVILVHTLERQHKRLLRLKTIKTNKAKK